MTLKFKLLRALLALCCVVFFVCRQGVSAQTIDTTRLNQDLLVAAKNGDIESVKTSLERGAAINAKDAAEESRGATPLILASAYGHFSVVQLLLDKGANVNAKTDSAGLTGLMLAAAQGHLSIVETLIAKGADLEAGNIKGCTPILFAACGRQFATKDQAAIVRLFLEKNLEVGGEIKTRTFVFHLASGCGHDDLFDVLKPEVLFRKVDNAIFLSNMGFFVMLNKSKTAITDALFDFGLKDIWNASSKGDTSTVEKLISADADINAKNSNSETALMVAIRTNRTMLVKLLLDKGADLQAKNNSGSTAMDIAKKLVSKENGDKEIVELLKAAAKKR